MENPWFVSSVQIEEVGQATMPVLLSFGSPLALSPSLAGSHASAAARLPILVTANCLVCGCGISEH
jgi:hypothetical protein